MAELTPEDRDRLDRDYGHRPENGATRGRHESLRSVFRSTAAAVMATVPPSRERSLALTKIEEARLIADAGINRELGGHEAA